MPVVYEFILAFKEEPALCRHSLHGIIGILVSLFPANKYSLPALRRSVNSTLL
jgi:hypothetical protein